MEAAEKIAVSCSDLKDHFFRDEKGRLIPIHQNAIITLADYPPNYFPYTDFPCRGLDDEEQDQVYELIVESELYLPLEKRYSCWNAYKAVLKSLREASSDSSYKPDQPSTTFSAREHRERINQQIKFLPNPIADAAALLRKEFAHFIELFQQSPCAAETLQLTRANITKKVLNQVWGEETELPFSRFRSVDQLKTYPYNCWPDSNIWTWEHFWEAVTPRLNGYIESASYMVLYRWLQYRIWLSEKPANSSPPTLPKLTDTSEDLKLPSGEQLSTGQSFSELFIKSEQVEPSIEALKRIRPDKPLVSSCGHWAGTRKDNSKGMLVAWIERLEDIGRIRRVANRRVLVQLLNSYFPGLNMGADARIFDNPTDETARLGFIALLPL